MRDSGHPTLGHSSIRRNLQPKEKKKTLQPESSKQILREESDPVQWSSVPTAERPVIPIEWVGQRQLRIGTETNSCTRISVPIFSSWREFLLPISHAEYVVPYSIHADLARIARDSSAAYGVTRPVFESTPGSASSDNLQVSRWRKCDCWSIHKLLRQQANSQCFSGQELLSFSWHIQC